MDTFVNPKDLENVASGVQEINSTCFRFWCYDSKTKVCENGSMTACSQNIGVHASDEHS